MNVYVETNFVLELVFAQEQYVSCEQVLALGESGHANLVVPAYCLAEPHEKLIRQKNDRLQLQQDLQRELRQLTRTQSYSARISTVEEIEGLLAQSIHEEQQRFVRYRDRLLNSAEVVPLTVEILQYAASFEAPFGLRPQDAIVFASVVTHLRAHSPLTCCFLNKNSKDFDNPDIVDELAKHNCRMIPRFDDGLRFLQTR